tara:strand:- start:2025 stop:4178 length:2154 start_codon:yes stop_codon:yes gene_type:complete
MAAYKLREGIDLSLIPDADISALAAENLPDVSQATLDYLLDKGSSWDAFTANAGRSITSGLRGLGVYQPDEAEDLQAEREARMLYDTNPASAIAGMVTGGLLEPVSLPFFFLKPIKLASSVYTAAARGAASGAVYGGIEPVYDEFDDSRMMNIGVGIGFGGLIGGAAGKIAAKFGFDPNSPTVKQDIENADPALQARMEAEMEAEFPTPDIEAKGPLLLGFNGKTSENVAPVYNIDFGGKAARYNPELKSMETVEVSPPTVDFTLSPLLTNKVKIQNVAAEGLDEIDEALWHIGGPNAQRADIALNKLSETTGMSHKELKLMATSSRREIVRRSAGLAKDGKLNFENKPSMFAATIRNRIDPPREIVTPIQPSRIDVKDGIDTLERELLKKAGVFMRVNPKTGALTFHNIDNGYKYLGNAELKERMNSVGINLDIPQFKQKSKAEASLAEAKPEMEAESVDIMAKVAPETPMSGQQALDRVIEANPDAPASLGIKALDELDRAPDDIGIPKQQRSVGSAGVDPKTYLGAELLPDTAKKLGNRKKPAVQETVLLKLLDNDDPRVAIPKDGDKAVKGAGTFAGSKKRGATELRKIINDYGNIPEFMLSRKGDPRGMSDAETIAMRWFHADAMANRARVMTRLKDIVNSQDSLDTPEVAKVMDDMVYYTGVDMFMRNEGTKISRALNARRILTQTIEQGQTPQTKLMRGMFPGMACGGGK